MNSITQLSRERRWQLLSTFLCFLFGLAFTANIQPVGDGLWFWYAVLMRGGQRLYADLHLPLQPLFVLLTVWTQELLGKGWLASKALAIAQLIAYCAGLFLVSGFIRWKDWQKAILIAGAFGMTITSFYSRFDDYHVTCYCFEIYSIYLLLRLKEEISFRQVFAVSTVLGIFSGLSTGTRLNEGAALFAGCGFALLFFVRSRWNSRSKKLLALLVFCAAASLTMLCVILLTGDTVHDWAINSIVRAAAIKGGTGHILNIPFTFPLRIINLILHGRRIIAIAVYTWMLTAIYIVALPTFRRSDGRLRIGRTAVVIGFLLVTVALFVMVSQWGEPNEAFAAFGALLCFALSVWIVVRLLRAIFRSKPAGWNPREVLVLMPFLQIMAGALTSGGLGLLEAYPPIAMLLLLLPISFPTYIESKWRKTAYVTMAGMIVVSSLIAKTAHPYYWHHFEDRTLFVDRQWYRHPLYGPMYIERDQLQFMRSICADLSKDGPPQSLLSITNPYPNYFCNVVPWHGYVQTWYDTTSKQTIDTLIGELRTAPPQWIIYQRGLDTMEAHETVFNGGRPIPHRALDRLIMDSINQGKWEVVQRTKFGGADWILMRTRR